MTVLLCVFFPVTVGMLSGIIYSLLALSKGVNAIARSQGQLLETIRATRRDLLTFPEVRLSRVHQGATEDWGNRYSQDAEAIENNLANNSFRTSQKEMLEAIREMRKDLMALPEIRLFRVLRGATEDWGNWYSHDPETIERSIRSRREP